VQQDTISAGERPQGAMLGTLLLAGPLGLLIL
jgi:hypothetical protein